MDQPSAAVPSCSDLPPLVSAFADAFVDFAVAGVFFPQNPSPDPTSSKPATRMPAPRRVVAVGDLHGDFSKSVEAFRLAGVLDPASGRWAGGSTFAVQLGDVLDRGGDELRLLYLLHSLKLGAAAAGGALISIIGNHEVMNVSGDFRFVTPDGLEEFRHWGFWYRAGLAIKGHCAGLETPVNAFLGIPKSLPGIKEEFWDGFRARIAALRPQGPISLRFLSNNPTVVVIGDSVFVHGSLLENHVEYGLEKINKEVRHWILGKHGRLKMPDFIQGRDSVVWSRMFSEGYNCDCKQLSRVLDMIPGVERMVMGHSIQKEGINRVCNMRAIRVDVGLSRGCRDGIPEVFEIDEQGKVTRVLTANRLYGHRHQQQAVKGVTRDEKDGLAWLARESGLKEVETKA